MIKKARLVALIGVLLVGCGPAAVPTAQPTAVPTRTPQPTVVPTPTRTPAAGDTWTRPADGMVMVYIPAGEFLMGSTEGDPYADLDEFPRRSITLDAFWIDRTEVTVGMFRGFVRATGYRTTAEQQGWGWTWADGEGWQQIYGADWRHPFGAESAAQDNHPVVQLSWDDAATYCAWSGGQLPSEAQWEKAARGTDGRIYPWGNEPDGSRGNFCDVNCPTDRRDPAYDDGHPTIAPVGSYPDGASPYGALDMAGNVWEWVADWYDGGYYTSAPSLNPSGPESGSARGIRGGAWNREPRYMRAANRYYDTPDPRIDLIGFRCVVSPAP